MESPILLSSAAALTLNQKIELVTADLQNQNNTPMLLDEITVHVDVSGGGFFDPQIKLRLALGRLPLTNGFVSMNMFGKVLNEAQSGFASGSAAVGGFYTWKLPKPLYIPAGELLIPTLFNDGSAASAIAGSQTVRVAYRGRSLGVDRPVPSKIYLPWVCQWDTGYNAGGAQYLDESHEPDLMNPYDSPLFVQRLLGRVQGFETAALQLYGGDLLTVRMTGSHGSDLVRDPTPFSHLFQLPERIWQVNAVLPPHGFYLASVDSDLRTVAGGTSVQASITLIGYREVNLKDPGKGF